MVVENDLEQPSSPSVKKSEEKGVVVVHEVKCKLYVKVFVSEKWNLNVSFLHELQQRRKLFDFSLSCILQRLHCENLLLLILFIYIYG